MKFYPSLEQMELYKDDYDAVPVSCEIFSDIKTPIEVLKAIKQLSKKCFLLESVEGGDKWGRYSFLGFDPVLELSLKDGVMTTTAQVKSSAKCADPMAAVRQVLGQYRCPEFDRLPPFSGGFVGYFSYRFYSYCEKIELRSNEGGIPDMYLMLFDKVIAFDNLRQKMVFICHARCDDAQKNYNRAVEELKSLIRIVTDNRVIAPEKGAVTGPFESDMTPRQHREAVERTKEHIREGDIFQAVISFGRSAPFSGSLMNAYRVLRTKNPSPYMFYMDCGKVELTGASPETLIKKDGDTLMTFPIAGTRPRGDTKESDEDNERSLLSDEKEKSEHCMLVDLGRNDLGKTAKTGSVKVREFMKINRFSHVMHLTSTVTAQAKDGVDGAAAIAAVMPAGTLSGAPKRRACQIIEQLEKRPRGIYGGCVGYIDFNGNTDMCIAIRMAVLADGRVTVQSGGGIVADSDPKTEYAETVNKAAAMTEALMECADVDYF